MLFVDLFPFLWLGIHIALRLLNHYKSDHLPHPKLILLFWCLLTYFTADKITQTPTNICHLWYNRLSFPGHITLQFSYTFPVWCCDMTKVTDIWVEIHLHPSYPKQCNFNYSPFTWNTLTGSTLSNNGWRLVKDIQGYFPFTYLLSHK